MHLAGRTLYSHFHVIRVGILACCQPALTCSGFSYRRRTVVGSIRSRPMPRPEQSKTKFHPCLELHVLGVINMNESLSTISIGSSSSELRRQCFLQLEASSAYCRQQVCIKLCSQIPLFVILDHHGNIGNHNMLWLRSAGVGVAVNCAHLGSCAHTIPQRFVTIA